MRLRSFLSAALLLVLAPIVAADILVTTASGGRNVAGACALRDAIVAINTLAPAGGCPAGASTDRILFDVGITHVTLSERDASSDNAGLPKIISGRGITVGDLHSPRVTIARNTGTACVRDGVRTAGEFRLFEVQGLLRLRNVSVLSGCADGAIAAARDGYGGAIMVRGVLDLERVTLQNNSARFGGGAIHVFHNDAAVDVLDSILIGNVAGLGGAIDAEGEVRIRRSLLQANAIFDNGVYASQGTAISGGAVDVDLINSTITGHLNFSSNADAATIDLIRGRSWIQLATIYANGGHGLGPGLTTVVNSIVANQSGNDCAVPGAGNHTHRGRNLFSDSTCRKLPAPPIDYNYHDADPRLQPLAMSPSGGQTPMLMPNTDSPAFDGALECPLDEFDAESFRDQSGLMRPEGPGGFAAGHLCDIGAAEVRFHIFRDSFGSLDP